jgi:glycosyltransferase involved in cell wall biosynthesis
MKPTVNIVIPVFNRPQHTLQTVTSLYKNTKRNSFRLIVIDDNSTVETAQLLRNLQEKYHFTLLRNDENIGPGESRNKACDYLTQDLAVLDYLYFSDNDVYFKKDWLEVLLNCYNQVRFKRIALLGASCHPYLKTNETMDLGEYKVCTKDAISGYSHLITWEIWNRFRYFDSQRNLDKKTGRSDDWAFCQKLINSGFMVASIEPEMVIPCGMTDTYGDKAIGQETFKKVDGIMVC